MSFLSIKLLATQLLKKKEEQETNPTPLIPLTNQPTLAVQLSLLLRVALLHCPYPFTT